MTMVMNTEHERPVPVGRLIFLVVEVIATFLCGYYVLRLDGLAKDVGGIELAFSRMGGKIEQMESSVTRLDTQVRELAKRMEGIEHRTTVIESRGQRP